MSRKRGGLAGIWDRNKKIIKPIATLAAGALTGGAGGALVGGLMNGLDREGKGGIGFDLKKGAIGAAQGYGMGKLGGALKSGVMSRLGAGVVNDQLMQGGTAAMEKGLSMVPDIAVPEVAGSAASSAMDSGITSSLLNAKTGITPLVGVTARGAAYVPPVPTINPMIAQQAANAGSNMSKLFQGAPESLGRSFLKDGKNIAAIGNTVVGGMNAYNANRANQIQREQMNRNNRMEDEDRARRDAMDPVRARLLQAMFQRMGVPS